MRYSVLVIFASIFFLTGLFMFEYLAAHDGKLHLVFCNVGQGDAIFLKTPKGQQILIDAGPDEKVLECLENHMPFWDRTLELVIVTHPHADHFRGLVHVLDRYIALTYATERLGNDTEDYLFIQSKLKEKNVPQQVLAAGNEYKTSDGVIIRIKSPTRSFIQETSPGGLVGESQEFASLIIEVRFGEFSALLTGDSQHRQIASAISNLKDLSVLQVPHHGSATGLTKEIVSKLTPEFAVISVGKNRYGHPHPSILRLFQNARIPVVRTDKSDTVVFITDGKTLIQK